MISSDWQSQIFAKKIGSLNLSQMGQNQAQNYIFCHFLKFSLLFFQDTSGET